MGQSMKTEKNSRLDAEVAAAAQDLEGCIAKVESDAVLAGRIEVAFARALVHLAKEWRSDVIA